MRRARGVKKQSRTRYPMSSSPRERNFRFHRGHHAVGDLLLGEDTLQEALAIALERLRDAIHLRGVQPEADDVHAIIAAVTGNDN